MAGDNMTRLRHVIHSLTEDSSIALDTATQCLDRIAFFHFIMSLHFI